MKKMAVIMASLLLMGCVAGCKDDTRKRPPEIDYVVPSYETYSNHIEIDGQWSQEDIGGANMTPNDIYGIGDPFVMRFNGKYYLYPSTWDGRPGVKVFESDNLVDWAYRGYAVSDEVSTVEGKTSTGAYAPEVVYYRGAFYMCQSRAGSGHYFYKSDDPLGPFRLVSHNDNLAPDDLDYGNMGMGIDGAFHVDDDGKLYFMHTSTPAGLKYNEIKDVDNITPDAFGPTRNMGNATLNHWIEGPGVIRRGDISYATYTGNHVQSAGYRVAYSYAKDLKNLAGFTQPENNVTLMDVSQDHKGLGHSSNTVGPDLDSIYTAYHDHVGFRPARRYNLDRYLTSGSVLTSNGVTKTPVAKPSAPSASVTDGSKLKDVDGFKAISVPSGDYFTAEYNIQDTAGKTLIFGGGKSDRYEIAFTDDGLRLSKVRGTTTEPLGSAVAVYDKAAINTVRVENGNGTGYIYLNGMRLITYEASAAPGAIGYASADGVGYTAFTNDVFGSSDFEAIKNMPSSIPAIDYLKQENRGFSIWDAAVKKDGVRLGEKESTRVIDDAHAVVLEKGDWVKYAVNAPEQEMYAIGATVSRESAGAKLEITIGDQTVDCVIPDVGAEGEDGEPTVNVALAKINVPKGVTTMRVRVKSGTAEFITIHTSTGATADSRYEGVDAFEKTHGNVTVSQDLLTVDGNDGVAIALWGPTGNANFELTMKVGIDFGTAANCGIVFRTKNFSYHKDQPAQSFIGYYLKLSTGMMELDKYNYGSMLLEASSLRDDNGNGLLETGVHTYTIRAEHDKFTVTVDGKYSLVAYDSHAYLDGQIGLYALNGRMTLHELQYKIL